MDDLNKLKRQRGTVRTACTRLTNATAGLMNADPIDVQKLARHKAQLLAKKEILQNLDGQIYNLLDDDKVAEADLEQSDIYQERLIDQIEDLSQRLDHERRVTVDQVNANTAAENQRVLEAAMTAQFAASQQALTAQLAASQQAMATQMAAQIQAIPAALRPAPPPDEEGGTIKLPMLQMTKFNGDSTKWYEFWSGFEIGVANNSKVKPKAKLVYLKTLLEGPAASVIAGLTPTDANYETAKTLLTNRFGKKRVIINAHLRALESVQPVKKYTDIAGLRKLHDDFELHVRSLENLEVQVSTFGALLSPKLMAAIPDVIANGFAQNEDDDENDIKAFLLYLNKQISLRERTADANGYLKETLGDDRKPAKTSQGKEHHWSKKKSAVPSVSALTVSSTECIFCNVSTHASTTCPLPPHKRRRNCMRAGRCFLCLETKHRVPDCKCKVFCGTCKRRHHTLLHEEDDEEDARVTAVVEHNNTDLFFQVMMVDVESQERKKTVQCFFDSGSHRTFITEKLAEELNAIEIGEKQMNLVPFGQRKSVAKTRKQVQVTLRDRNGGDDSIEIHAIVVPWITGSVVKPANTKIQTMMAQRGIRLDVQNEDLTKSEVSVLVGIDYFWQIATGQIERLGQGLVGLKTLFGWTILGSSGNREEKNQSLTIQVNATQYEEKLEVKLQKFWELDTLGILHESNSEKMDNDLQAIECFEKSLKWTGERYEVRLPWLTTKEELDDKYTIALRRFWNLVRKFKQDTRLYGQYKIVIETQLAEGIVEDVTGDSDRTNRCYYLPHSPVIREQRETTKLRVVCDASSHGARSRSLNDCLFTGPNLLPELLNILIKFRIFKFAVTGDIEKAFHQIGVNVDDRDCLRFFWMQDDWDGKGPIKLRILRFTRVLFGASPSPFLLNATIQSHVQKFLERYPDTVNQMNNNFYVDDFVNSQPHEEQILQTCREATVIMRDANMRLTKWVSNSQLVQDAMSPTGGQERKMTKVLGMVWNTQTDILTLEMGELMELCALKEVTKRQVIRLVASVFDPLGFCTPFTVTGKLIFQDLWRLQIGWDEPLPESEAKKWHAWKEQIPELSAIKVPRWMGIRHETKTELHLFCDASPLAYGVVAYAKTKGSSANNISFIFSKSRIAPVKTITLPRLELMGALLASRLVKRLDVLPTHRVVCWTDSTIVLAWIKHYKGKTDLFVTRRADEIRDNAPDVEWRHVPGRENPADMLTRGRDANKLINEMTWWNGPNWLSQHENCWPQATEVPLTTEDELEAVVTVTIERLSTLEPILDPAKYGNWTRLLRVTSWIIRFVDNLKLRTRNNTPLTITELTKATKYWIRIVQQDSYANEVESVKGGQIGLKLAGGGFIECGHDTDGLVVVRTRLERETGGSMAARPWILYRKHHVTDLIIRDAHQKVFHGGLGDTLAELRTQYWITRARACIKRILNSCFVCRQIQGRLMRQSEAPLPLSRTKQADPFQVVGVDFAGPLYQKAGQKCYIVLFTCAVTRAIHLELTTTMNTEDFILSLRRLFARRGVPTQIYSDNAKTFKRADTEIRFLMNNVHGEVINSFLTKRNVEWKFIVERAAWWGGFWERMVRSVKGSLKKILGKRTLTFEELSTTLCEVEAMINSRPITYVYNDIHEREPLTPSHFLVGKRQVTLPNANRTLPIKSNASSTELLKRWKLRERLLKHYWNRWHREYLTELRVFKVMQKQPSLKKEDVVLIQDENQPRSGWLMGQVTETFLGRDNKVRSCEIRLSNGKLLRRPIQRLCVLESHGEEVKTSPTGRTVKIKNLKCLI